MTLVPLVPLTSICRSVALREAPETPTRLADAGAGEARGEVHGRRGGARGRLDRVDGDLRALHRGGDAADAHERDGPARDEGEGAGDVVGGGQRGAGAGPDERQAEGHVRE